MSRCVLHAGPSAWGLAPTLIGGAGVEQRPPAQKGDVDRLLVEPGQPGTIVVCDGIFQSVPAISHAELCRALDAGWAVWGVSSIGAIRAWELRGEGMRGSGEVHAMFERLDDFTDDEMCQLHFPDAPYFPLSEPLVNVRFALDRHAGALSIEEAEGAALVDRLGQLWFGDRTHERIRAILVHDLSVPATRADAFLAALARCRVKTLDLAHLLTQRPWAAGPACQPALSSSGPVPPTGPPPGA